MVVGVLESHLEGVMVDIADRELGRESFDAHGLELEIGHGARRVLGQGLVDADADLAAALPLALDEVGLEYLPRKTFAHAASVVYGHSGSKKLHKDARRNTARCFFRRLIYQLAPGMLYSRIP